MNYPGPIARNCPDPSTLNHRTRSYRSHGTIRSYTSTCSKRLPLSSVPCTVPRFVLPPGLAPCGAAVLASAATKTIAMTTLQKTLVTVTPTGATGFGIYEARQAAQLRDHQGGAAARQQQRLRPGLPRRRHAGGVRQGSGPEHLPGGQESDQQNAGGSRRRGVESRRQTRTIAIRLTTRPGGSK